MIAENPDPPHHPHSSLNALLHNLPDAVIAVDGAFKTLYWNPAAETLFGVSVADAHSRLQSDLYDMIWPDPDERQRAIDCLLSVGSWRGESNIVRHDGTAVRVEANVSVLRDDYGNSLGVVASIRDIGPRTAAEQRTLKAEAEFQALLESGIVAVARSTETRFLYVNDYFCSMLGYSREELLEGGIDWQTLSLKKNLASLNANMAKLRTVGRVMPFAKEYCRKDGSIASVILCGYATCQEPLEFITFLLDDSERKEIEQRSLVAEAQFRALVDSNIIGIVQSNESGFISVNDYFCRILGYSREELLSGTIDWRALTLDNGIDVLEERMAQLRTDGCVMPFDKVYRCKDGSLASVLLSAIATRRDPLEWISVVQDLSERKKVFDALLESEERYRTVIESVAEGITVLDAQGNFVSANASAELLLGLKLDQLKQHPGGDQFWRGLREDGSPLPSDEFPGILAIRTGRPQYGTVIGVRQPGGTIVWLQVNARPLHDPATGRLIGSVSSYFDISDRKMAEQRLRDRAAREAFINRINEAIRATFDPVAIQYSVANLLGELLKLDRCFYIQYDEANDLIFRAPDFHRPDLRSIQGFDRYSDAFRGRDQMFSTGTAVIADVEASDLPDDMKVSLCKLDERSLIAVPFYDRGGYAAALVCAMAEPREWTHEEIHLVEQAATMTHSAVLAANVVKRDTAIANQLQDALRPAIPQRIAGLTLASFYRPALEEAQVGGDFVDVFPAGDGSVYLVVGDVSGKGLAAASQVATIRNMLRFALLSDKSMTAALGKLNAIVAGHDQINGFVTLFTARYDAQTRTLSYVNCGHEAGLHVTSATGESQALPPTGTVLGAFPEASFGVETRQLSEGDLLVVFTDGFTEAGHAPSELLTGEGMARLVAAAHPVTEPQRLVDLLMSAVDAHTNGVVRDDQCVLVAMA
ncbi:MAG: PAS domain S-box protein [Capsulimonadaceae bacterium]|nr:PAS domain S-box protein [Capsulimonadaceae bacterium]